MSAISSLTSFGNRPLQGATLQSAQQGQRGGTTFGSTSTARGGNAAQNSAAYCPTCGVGGTSSARSASSVSSSYCPTCNTAGGRQTSLAGASNPASLRSGSGAPQSGAANTLNHSHQGGRICVGCAYQGR